MTTQKCQRCPAIIRVRPNAKYCDACRPIVKAESITANSAVIEANRLERLRVKGELSTYAPKRSTSPISDAEQELLNTAIDNRHATPFAIKIYVPGTAEFRRVAREVTPLNRIRGREELLIYQEEALDYRHTRRESSGAI